MKSQHLVILIILVAVIGGAGLLLRQRQTESWNNADSRAGQELLGKLQVNDVTHIRIQGTNGELNVSKTGDIWTVRERDEYPANFSKVVEVVNKLAGLKVIQPQNTTQETLGRFHLLPLGKGSNSATIVELKGKDDKTLVSLRLGKSHLSQSPGGMGGEWPDGRYVMVGDDLKTVALIKDALSDLEARPDQWISKDFLKVERVQSVAVKAPEPTNSWSVSRQSESGEWKLAEIPEGKELDKTKVSSLNTLLSSPYFNDIVTGKKPDELGFEHARVATIDTFDHLTYTVRIGDTNAEGNYYVGVDVEGKLPAEREAVADEKPEDKEKADKEFKEKQDKLKEKLEKEQRLKNWSYTVSKWTVDPLLKNHADLLTDKKPEPPPVSAPLENPTFPDPTFPDPTLPQPFSSPPSLPKQPKIEPDQPVPPLPEKPSEAPNEKEPDKPAVENKPAEPIKENPEAREKQPQGISDFQFPNVD